MDTDNPWRIEGPIDFVQPPAIVDSAGADALAFYLPFHFYREDWGVYIRTSGVLYLAQVLKDQDCPLLPGDEEYLNLAEAMLYEHELCHACAERPNRRRTPRILGSGGVGENL